MRIIYHPEAETELIEAAQFYHRRVPGLGADFLDTVDEGVSLIMQAPERWRILEDDVRRYLLPRFPFALIYRVYADELRILAVKHHSRRPDYWRERLAD
jgi:plasmid stabilization system protein ParE